MAKNVTFPSVIMIGSDHQVQGDIGSVLSTYYNNGFLNDKIYLISHREGAAWYRVWLFARCTLHLIWHLLSKPNIKIIHLHMSERGSFYRKALLCLLCFLFRKKTILHFHGAEFMLFVENSPAPLQWFIRYILNSATALFVLSESWKSDFSRVTGNENIFVVYNPVFFDETKICNNSATETGLGPLKCLFLGRFGQRKGVYDLIRAVATLDETVPFHLALYGDGELDQVKRLIEELNVGGRVHVHGWIRGEAKHRALCNTDVLILPSYNEGLPVAILEAMAYGLAVISTPVGGIAEAVHHERNGLLVPPGDVSALANALLRLANEPGTVVRFQEESRLMCRAHFAHQCIFERLSDLYENIISSDFKTRAEG